MLESETNLSTDMAVAIAKDFLRKMAQPFRARDQEGISTWNLADLERHIEKERSEAQKRRREEDDARVSSRTINGASNGRTTAVDEFDDDIDEELMTMDAD
jgi:DNA excision repair protein ERCC-2